MPRLKPGDLPLLARTSDGYIYENPDAFPRVLFATEAKAADFARMLADGVWPPPTCASTVLLERPPARPPRPAAPASVRIASYRNTEVMLEADSPDGGWVVLNDLWHPWWFAEVDGRRPSSCAPTSCSAPSPSARPAQVRFTFRPLAGARAQLEMTAFDNSRLVWPMAGTASEARSSRRRAVCPLRSNGASTHAASGRRAARSR